MASLSKKSQPNRDFNFLSGLSRIVERSVQLEFDRKVVNDRLHDAEKIYPSAQVNGWTIKGAAGYGLYGNAILMEDGGNISARRLNEMDKEEYRQAMGSIYDFEHQLLTSDFNGRTEIRLANPDFHDGQVLVNRKTRTLVLIDMGQSVRLTERGRNLGFDLAAIVSGLQSSKEALSTLNDWFPSKSNIPNLTEAELKDTLSRKDPMDKLIRIVSLLGQKNIDVDLDAVQMVLGLNRLAILGRKIGRHPNITLGAFLAKREFSRFINNTMKLTGSPQRPTGRTNMCLKFYD